MRAYGFQTAARAACSFLLAILLFGCSDDNPSGPGAPEDPRVTTVVIAPGSVTLNSVGEDVQFDAAAFDQNGSAIDADFTWQSSNEGVVIIGENGVAVASGLGSAEVYVTAGSAVDTADVTVTLAGAPVYEWAAATSGNWNDAGNWSGGAVPGAGDVAVITASGTYTVTLNGDVEIKDVVLGAASGTQTLDTNGNQFRLTNGGLLGGAQLVVSGGVVVQGDLVWTGGTMTGSGQVTIESGAELHAIGNPLNLEVDLDNSGTVTGGAGASLRVNRLLECRTGAIIDLQGDANVTVQNAGNLSSNGAIRKSLGEQEATILASSALLSSAGSLRVEEGSLWISGGELRGIIEIDGDAMLRQTGDTAIPSVNSQGDGPFVIGGNVTIGTYVNQVVTFGNVILDSSDPAAVTGPASLLINHSFIWRRGTVSDLGRLNTGIVSQTSFENTGTSVLSGTNWRIEGEVSGDSNVNLALANGATISVENAGRWRQSAGGTISQGVGNAGDFTVIGEFHKTGEGAFVVKTPFSCSGILNLAAGALTVEGDFLLSDTGLITGGGTADPTFNTRLILVAAQSAVMRGTVRPGLDEGVYARMDIQGLVDLEPTFRVELDVATDGAFNTESVYFLTGGQVFGGTLALNVLRPVTRGVDYKVVYSSGASGAFAVTGDAQFDEVIQDADGVVCRQN